MHLKKAFEIVKRDLAESLNDSGLELRVAILELRCNLVPSGGEGGKIKPVVRTEVDEKTQPAHRLQLSISLPDIAPESVQFKARPRS